MMQRGGRKNAWIDKNPYAPGALRYCVEFEDGEVAGGVTVGPPSVDIEDRTVTAHGG